MWLQAPIAPSDVLGAARFSCGDKRFNPKGATKRCEPPIPFSGKKCPDGVPKLVETGSKKMP